jgi:hypothetical protein
VAPTPPHGLACCSCFSTNVESCNKAYLPGVVRPHPRPIKWLLFCIISISRPRFPQISLSFRPLFTHCLLWTLLSISFYKCGWAGTIYRSPLWMRQNRIGLSTLCTARPIFRSSLPCFSSSVGNFSSPYDALEFTAMLPLLITPDWRCLRQPGFVRLVAGHPIN